jgi:hypothetical protein
MANPNDNLYEFDHFRLDLSENQEAIALLEKVRPASITTPSKRWATPTPSPDDAPPPSGSSPS